MTSAVIGHKLGGMNIHSLPGALMVLSLAPEESKPNTKREAVLHAALALFAARGYHGTAVPEVAALAGVGTGTIYRYFNNKEALVNAVFQRAKRLLKDILMQDLQLNAQPRQVFTHFWSRLTWFARQLPLEFKFLELQDHVPYLDQESRNVELEVLAPIWTYCVTARRDGVARDIPAEALMALIWGAFVGLMKAEHTGHIRLDDSILAAAEEACWASFSGLHEAPLIFHDESHSRRN